MPKQSWDHVANWYDSLVGAQGQYYHQHVIFPNVIRLLALEPKMYVLDLACGQGAFCREISKLHVHVTGVDASPRLLESAQKYPLGANRSLVVKYVLDDARTLKKFEGELFDRIACILALQNIDPIDETFARMGRMLKSGGYFVAVILHPAFRSPRITGWGEDESRKLQFRRVDRYSTPMKIPIETHPGKGQHQLTWTYHRPLQTYVELGTKNGLVIDAIEEWVSDKTSEGKHARQENLARSEIPMFMAIRWRKL